MYNAISIDGFIADQKMSSEWVSEVDWNIFASYIKQYDTIIMGRKTWDDAGKNFGTGINIVYTKSKELHGASTNKTLFTPQKIGALLKSLEDKGISKALLIGGGNLNAQFLDMNLIDELIIDIHPIIIGSGIKLFEYSNTIQNFTLTETKILKNKQVLIKYRSPNYSSKPI